ncbi:MAG: EAL domain-containing protein, partial [Bacilli bacterium]|nr:EAL domain-containing protein [Bacilli bacterium]
LSHANRSFSFIPGRLFAFSTAEDALICFLPAYDSLSVIEEKLLSMCDDCAISAKSPTGLTLKPLKGAFVSYPSSKEEDIFHDLGYARRQGNSFNVFFPDRSANNTDNTTLVTHEQDTSFFHRAHIPLYRLSGVEREKEKKIIKQVFESIRLYLGADRSDLIYWERNTDRNYSYFEDTLTAKTFPREEINKVREVSDRNNAYYFSSRASLSSVLARKMDEMGVTSGYLYCFDDGNEFLGFMYFLKSNGNLLLDAYRQEGLNRVGKILTDYFSLAQKEERANAALAETEHILAMSNYGIYKVRDSDYHITYISPNLRTLFPNAVIGEPCHKAMYGYAKMCPHCPIRDFSKMESDVKGSHLVTSLTLNDRKSHERSMLVEVGSPGYELFDKNWLVYSYRTLLEQLRNIYINNGRGYLLLLCIDNIELFLTKQGGEGTLFAIRSFIEKIKFAYQTHDVYAYNPSTIGLLLPRVGHAEIIDVCEKIYNLSKESSFDDGTNKDVFKITYLPLGYPQGYSSPEEFLSHVEDHYRNPKLGHNIDYIYFYNHSIACAASRTKYMTDIIDKTFGEDDVNCVTLQPMLDSSRHIYGAEILLRVMDDYRQRPIQAWELSQIAVQTGKIPVITSALIRFVEALYKEYGSSVFAVNAFSRVAINTDSTFLEDKAMMEYVKNLYTNHVLPENFIAFEISEDLIKDDFITKTKDFLASGVALVCDRYSGRDVSVEKLKAFGFSKIKITRDLIKDIDSNPNRKEEVLQLIGQAKELGLKIGAVGVENEEQFNILKSADPNVEVQGFLFYKPLARSDLISAIRSHR